MIKTYLFRVQIKKRGCYAEIHYEVEFHEGSSGFELHYFADPIWETISRAATLIFQEYLSRIMTGNLRLTIHKIDWLDVDTNSLVVLFAIVKALVEEFKLCEVNLSFDLKDELFCFPESRTLLF